MKILGIDQSLSKCAMTPMVDGVPKEQILVKTGKLGIKTVRKDTLYFDCLHKQIRHICEQLHKTVEEFQPEQVVFEALSFGSVGDATRSLACLYGAMRDVMQEHYPDITVTEYAPTSLESYAREKLNITDQYEKDDQGNMVYLKSKKPKKVKMDKKLMVKAVKNIYGESYFRGYNYSSGLDDLADSTLLALKLTEENAKT